MTQSEMLEFFDRLSAIHSTVASIDGRVTSIQRQIDDIVESEENETENWKRLLDPHNGVIVRVGRLESRVDELEAAAKEKRDDGKRRISRVMWTIIGAIITISTGMIGAFIANAIK